MANHRDIPTLLEKDFCIHGHDVRDKETALYVQQVGDKTYSSCRECSKLALARNKAKRVSGDNKPLKPKLVKEIIAILNEYDEVALMKILIRLKEKALG